MSNGQLRDEDDVGARRRGRSAARSSPACRPITSTTMTRSWDSAVVCSRSIASVAVCTAVSNPNVTSVADRSLSIVLGTPTTSGALARRASAATPSVSSPPIAISASMRSPAQRVEHPRDAVVGLERVRPARAEDRPAPRQDARGCSRWSARPCRTRSTPRQPCRNPRNVVAVDPFALADDGADHRVEPRAVAAAGQHSDAHGRLLSSPAHPAAARRAPDSLRTVNARTKVEEAARWRLEIGEPLLAGGFAWIAFPRPQVSLLVLARRAHLVGLTDRRLLIWARPARGAPGRRQGPRARRAVRRRHARRRPHVLADAAAAPRDRRRAASSCSSSGPRDRRLGHRIAEALGGEAASRARPPDTEVPAATT